MRTEESILEGRNAIIEAMRSGVTIDKLFILDGSREGSLKGIVRDAKKTGVPVTFVNRQRLDQLSATGKHQGVIAYAAAYAYREIEDILTLARERGEQPFVVLLDGIEDPHNLGAIIRSANMAGAHGVIIPKRRAVGLTATVAKASAGALAYTPVVRVTNLVAAIEELKKEGLWFVSASMEGKPMYEVDMTGPIGLVVGNEGSGVSRLVEEACDLYARIPTVGNIDSLNASVAAGILAFEIVRQRGSKIQ
ncbi:MAG: 23S rRNA (guanosine(2251)-2'-O)-methyltransferase RlmB [Lachnospiraceae bacterium]|nr:23S rRNA (guanosine(2251)-2'-O)-methyltransferase RlmB [Lachnospiraceae bacterium]MDY5742219.1 23S rRNA (guanosine(2251)-2'-O)-methyltransferase RlmB [Lachnospiraceae bacterium]